MRDPVSKRELLAVDKDICGFLLACEREDCCGAHEMLKPHLEDPEATKLFIYRLAGLGLAWIDNWVEDTGLNARDFLTDAAQVLAEQQA
jgi:hypothetical protein